MLLIICYILQLESTNETSRESTTDPPKSKKVSFNRYAKQARAFHLTIQ